MPTASDVEYRLAELAKTLERPEDAYVVRSRLDRALLVCRRYLSEAVVPPTDAAVAYSLISEIEAAFVAIRRRSEPFGEAWVAKLQDTRPLIAELVRHVVALRV